MKTLIAEDDFTSRLMLQGILKRYGPVDLAANGREAVDAVGAALEGGEGYDLICLDVMMPEIDGYEALKQIRGMEASRGIVSSRGAKIFMTTALGEIKNVADAYFGFCDAYLQKPIAMPKLLQQLQEFELISRF
jgi:two-component system chemotaxis response regulator CheY